MKIAIIGLGAVALADALALARKHEIILTGPVPDLVDAINARRFILADRFLGTYLSDHNVALRATLDTRAALEGAQMVFVSAPLSRDTETGKLHTVELESRIELATRLLPQAPIIIRSAVPVGFTEMVQRRLKGAKLVYAPEFSRVGHVLWDVLHPSFLAIGDKGKLGLTTAQILADASMVDDIPLYQMNASETEALRHLSVLFHDTQVTYISDDVYPSKTLPNKNAAPNLQGIHARVAALARQIKDRGAHRIGFYAPARADRTQTSLARLQSMMGAAGLDTEIHISGTAGLDRFKTSCDFIVAQTVTADLFDIATKVLTPERIMTA
jgi:UDPglucose 6-dehydrogenase